jgi:hypothetical protein
MNVRSLTNERSFEEGEMHKCECCSKQRLGCEWQEASKYWLCSDCRSKIKERLERSTAAKHSEAVQSCQEGVYVIDRSELKALRMDGLLSIKAYVYFALRLEYPPDSAQEIDAEQFCKHWSIPYHEFLSAIAALHRNGITHVATKHLNVETRTRKQRIASLEKGVQ